MATATDSMQGGERWEGLVQDQLEALLGEAWKQKELRYAFNRDPAIAAFFGAFVIESLDPAIWRSFGDAIHNRLETKDHPEPVIPSMIANHWQKVFQFIYTTQPWEFDGDLNDLDYNRRMIRKVMLDEEGKDLDSIAQSIYANTNVSSTKRKRYALPKLFSLRVQQELGEPLTIEDNGTGSGLGPKMLALPDPSLFPFGPVQILLDGPDGPEAEPGGHLSRRLQERLRLRLLTRLVMGVELPLVDRRWPEVCTFRPAQRTSEALADWRRLDELNNIPGVTTVYEDILASRRRTGGAPMFNIGMALTVGHQIHEAEQPAFLDAIIGDLKPKNSYVVWFDYFKRDPTAQIGISAVPTWDPFTYKMYILATNELDEGFKLMFSAEDGNCDRVVAHDEDKVKIGGKAYSGVDLVRGLRA